MNLFAEAVNFFSAALQCVPFMILAVLAYVGVKNPSLKFVAVGWLAMLILSFIGIAVLFGVMTGLDLRKLLENPGTPPLLRVSGLRLFGVLGAGIFAAILAAVLCYLPPVRRVLARLLPMSADSFVHATALAAVVTLSILCVLPLIAAGEPPVLALIRDMPTEATGGALMDASTSSRALLYTLVWMVPCTIVAVGAGTIRSVPESLQRLGFVRPSLRQVLLGVAVAVALVVIVSVLSLGLDAVWQAMGWPKTDAETFSKLIAFAMNPLGALLVGIVAGVGEELAVRGVLQPRLGILVSNVFFTALHALQYGWDALLIVFAVGIAMGVLRKRTNTSTSAIAHGAYDFILLMLAWAQVPGFGK